MAWSPSSCPTFSCSRDACWRKPDATSADLVFAIRVGCPATAALLDRSPVLPQSLRSAGFVDPAENSVNELAESRVVATTGLRHDAGGQEPVHGQVHDQPAPLPRLRA